MGLKDNKKPTSKTPTWNVTVKFMRWLYKILRSQVFRVDIIENTHYHTYRQSGLGVNKSFHI